MPTETLIATPSWTVQFALTEGLPIMATETDEDTDGFRFTYEYMVWAAKDMTVVGTDDGRGETYLQVVREARMAIEAVPATEDKTLLIRVNVSDGTGQNFRLGCWETRFEALAALYTMEADLG